MAPIEQFAANLRQLRQAAGLSQEKLAAQAELHRTEISLLERASREPRLLTIVALSRALKIKPEELLRGVK